MLKSFFSKNKRSLLFGSAGTLLGAAAGFLYWKFVGCLGESCMIWSNPLRATLYGALLGTLLLLAVMPDRSSKKNS